MYAIVATIPRGRVATYGLIAALAGRPGNARQVGYALRVLEDEDVPWHRVLNAGGTVSRRSGSTGYKEGHQRHLLEEEGVQFSSAGSIDLDRYLWQPRLRIRREASADR